MDKEPYDGPNKAVGLSEFNAGATGRYPEVLRERALQMAIDSDRASLTSDELVKRASAFEAYLKGDG